MQIVQSTIKNEIGLYNLVPAGDQLTFHSFAGLAAAGDGLLPSG